MEECKNIATTSSSLKTSKQIETPNVEIVEEENKPVPVQSNNDLSIYDVLNRLLPQTNNFDVSKKENKTTIKVDSDDKQSRTIVTIEKKPLERTTIINVTKPSIQERREIVKKLRTEGKSQTEIASITMVSQKTISNDLKKIISNKT